MAYNNGGLNYGQLVRELERLPLETNIRFDFGCNVPKNWHSYRGYYEDLAIGYTDEDHGEFTVKDFLDILSNAKAGTLYGYKGGEYKVTDRTSVWVSQDSSQCTGTYIDRIHDFGDGFAIIYTSYED